MRTTTLLALAAVLAVSAPGQSFTYMDFSSTAGLTLVPNAAQVGNVLRVNSAVISDKGAFYASGPISVANGFDTTFTFQVTNPSAGGGDGMTFVVHNDVRGTMALGSHASQMGYGAFAGAAPGTAIANSLVVEIDTYQNGNGDPNGNHVSVHTNGTGDNDANESFSLGSATPTTNMSDGSVHTMRIRYIPGTLEVYVDNVTTPLLTVPYDFVNGGTWANSGTAVGGLSLISGEAAWIGFTAGNGGAWEDHDVLSWDWTSPLIDPCFAGTVGASAGGPFDVLTVNGSTGGFGRLVSVSTFDPITISMANPTTSPIPANFIIFGMTQFPTAADLYPLPFGGTMCFVPFLVFPNAPLFILTDNFSANPANLVSSFPAPWGFTLATGVPFPFQFALQGVIAEAPGVLAITNGVMVDIVQGPPPAITSVTPGAAGAGTTVQIVGTDFSPGASVTVDGTPVTPTSISPTQIDFTVPAGGFGCDASIDVMNPDGQTATAPFNPTPAVTFTTFGSGPVAGGANFIIIGTGFVPGTTVDIDGNAATIISTNPTSMVVQTPPGAAPGTVTVTVTGPTGCVGTTTYTYI